MKLLILLSSILFLTNCGTDGGSSSNSSTPAQELTLTSGTYSYWSSPIQIECTDGSTGTADPEALNVYVTFYDNHEIEITGEDLIPYEGLHLANGEFSATAEEEVEDPDFGRISITRTMSGFFSQDGWYGELNVSAVFVDGNFVCDYVNTFVGELQ